MSSSPIADVHVLAPTARELLTESHDPRVLDICRTLLALLEPAGGVPLPPRRAARVPGLRPPLRRRPGAPAAYPSTAPSTAAAPEVVPPPSTSPGGIPCRRRAAPRR